MKKRPEIGTELSTIFRPRPKGTMGAWQVRPALSCFGYIGLFLASPAAKAFAKHYQYIWLCGGANTTKDVLVLKCSNLTGKKVKGDIEV